MKKAKKTSPRLKRTRKGRCSKTSEVLGRQPGTRSAIPKIKRQWRGQHQALRRLRDELLAQMGGLSRQAREEAPKHSMHMADAGTDSFDRDFALSLLSSDQNALYEIEEAIQRIESGTYGICEMTGQPIPAKRLAAIPWARYSAEGQKQIEQQGLAQHPHLTPLQAISIQSTAEEEGEEEEDKT